MLFMLLLLLLSLSLLMLLPSLPLMLCCCRRRNTVVSAGAGAGAGAPGEQCSGEANQATSTAGVALAAKGEVQGEAVESEGCQLAGSLEVSQHYHCQASGGRAIISGVYY